jgi:hypothetical protein
MGTRVAVSSKVCLKHLDALWKHDPWVAVWAYVSYEKKDPIPAQAYVQQVLPAGYMLIIGTYGTVEQKASTLQPPSSLGRVYPQLELASECFLQC